MVFRMFISHLEEKLVAFNVSRSMKNEPRCTQHDYLRAQNEWWSTQNETLRTQIEPLSTQNERLLS